MKTLSTVAALAIIIILLLGTQQLMGQQKYSAKDGSLAKKQEIKKKIVIYQSAIVVKGNSKRTIKGYLYSRSDSSLFILPVDKRWRVDINSKPVEIPYNRIELVRVRKKKIGSNAFLVGALVGTIVTVPTLIIASGGYIVIGTIIFFTIPASATIGLTTLGIASIWTKISNVATSEKQEFLKNNTMVARGISVEDLAGAFAKKSQ